LPERSVFIGCSEHQERQLSVERAVLIRHEVEDSLSSGGLHVVGDAEPLLDGPLALMPWRLF
jgi:hypothetical protein